VIRQRHYFDMTAVECSAYLLLFLSVMSQGLGISVQCTALNIGISFGLQTHVTSNRLAVHCTLNFCMSSEQMTSN
jgi:hypothetical protein